MCNFEAAYKRIQQALRVSTQMEIAQILNVRQSSVSDAKRRRSLPDGWVVTLALEKTLNPAWIVHGQEPQYLPKPQAIGEAWPQAGEGQESQPQSQKTHIPTMTIVLGLPGAGKSSYVQQLPWSNHRVVVCFDTLRRALGHTYSPTTEPHVYALACTMVRVAFLQGQSIIIDESITTPGIAQALTAIAHEFKVPVRMVHIATPTQKCRANRVPYGFPPADFDRKVVEWDQHGQFILSMGDEVYALNAEVKS